MQKKSHNFTGFHVSIPFTKSFKIYKFWQFSKILKNLQIFQLKNTLDYSFLEGMYNITLKKLSSKRKKVKKMDSQISSSKRLKNAQFSSF